MLKIKKGKHEWAAQVQDAWEIWEGRWETGWICKGLQREMLPAPLLRTLEGTTSRRWMERNNPASLRRWLGAWRANPASLLKPKMEQKQCELLCCHTKCFPHSAIRLRSIWSSSATRSDSHFRNKSNFPPSFTLSSSVHLTLVGQDFEIWGCFWRTAGFQHNVAGFSCSCCPCFTLLGQT